jgi:hypothetical protein
LRLLVPRRGRGRGLGGLAAGLAAVALVLAVVLTAGDGERPAPPRPTPTPTPTPTPERARLDTPGGRSLAVGITEPNPNLFAPDDVLTPPAGWARWRDELVRMRPELYRLVIEWNTLQPSPEAPANLALPDGGCMRDKAPCAPWSGVADQLRALAARQREGGWQALVVFTGTPEWVAARPHGCAGEEGGSRAPRDLASYRALVSAVLDLAAAEGAELHYFTPWNEPNHPYSLAPQRKACDALAPSRAIRPYARLAHALRAELAEHGRGDDQLVLGEMAGILEPTARATSVGEMIRGLPRELVCAAPVWSQHAYIGGTDPVATLKSALGSRHCPRKHAIWITETGVGPAPGGFSLARGITSEAQGCRLLHRRLRSWRADPSVTVATQYTMREDDLFPTGLVTTDLTRERRALREWQAWGTRDPGAPPPRSTCG